MVEGIVLNQYLYNLYFLYLVYKSQKSKEPT